MMDLADIRTSLTDIAAAVSAITLPPAYGDPAVAAFDKVKIFDLQDLAVAMEELFAYADRIAIIALDGINHDSEVGGNSLKLKRSATVTILCADRRYSDRQKALMGDSATPGALQLQKLLVDALAGRLSGGSVAVPAAGRLALVEHDQRRNDPGRIVFAQDFEISAGWESVSLGRDARIAATR